MIVMGLRNAKGSNKVHLVDVFHTSDPLFYPPLVAGMMSLMA